MKFWLTQNAIAFDQLVNALFGGYSDETLSARAHRSNGWGRMVINMIFFWQNDHCYDAYLAEKRRAQLPRHYR
jgi:hypothetical protein